MISEADFHPHAPIPSLQAATDKDVAGIPVKSSYGNADALII